MSEQSFIEDYLERARNNLQLAEESSNDEGTDHRGYAEYCVSEILEYFPFQKDALEILQELCKERMSVYAVNYRASIRGSVVDIEQLWYMFQPNYRKYINAALTIIGTYPAERSHQVQELLEDVFIYECLDEKFHIIDPYLYFLKELLNDRLSLRNANTFYELLSSDEWQKIFLAHSKHIKQALSIGSELLGINNELKLLRDMTEELLYGVKIGDTPEYSGRIRIKISSGSKTREEKGLVWIDHEDIDLEPQAFQTLLCLARAAKKAFPNEPTEKYVKTERLVKAVFFYLENGKEFTIRDDTDQGLRDAFHKLRTPINLKGFPADNIVCTKRGFRWLNINPLNIDIIEEDQDSEI